MDFLYLLQNLRCTPLNIFFMFCTQFAEEIVVTGIFVITFWCINKTIGYKIIFSYFLSGLTVQGLKLCFRIDRPWILDPNFKPVDSALETATGYSFPSGHTQTATSLYGSIAFHFKKAKIYILCFVIIALVMLSRMFLGCHTPLDVSVSFLVSIIITYIVSYVWNNFNSSKTSDIIVMILMELFSIITIGYVYWVVKTGRSTEVLAMDAFKISGGVMGFAIGWFIEKNYINFSVKTERTITQVIKVIVGLLITLILKSGLKLILGDTIPTNILRYFFVALWVVAIYPLFIKMIITKHNL